MEPYVRRGAATAQRDATAVFDGGSVHATAVAIARYIRLTPLMPIIGSQLMAKCENLQVSGSFKWRGAVNALVHSRSRCVVTGSSGNHAIALALAGQMLGVGTVVVMPPEASGWKRARLEALGRAS